MDENGITPGGWLVQCFVEFTLLPDLLDAYQPDAENIPTWMRILEENDFNAYHVENEYIPEGLDLTEFMAVDALRFCRSYGLIGPRGALTRQGQRIANIAGTPTRQRGDRETRVLAQTLADQIQFRYRGEHEVYVTDLLQAASAILSSLGQPWDRVLGGLLLAELDTLLHWSATDGRIAESLVWRLPEIRSEVLGAIRQSQTPQERRRRLDPFDVVQVLTEVHWSRPRLAQSSVLTTTELQATSMALSFAQLLSPTWMEPRLQVLRPLVR